MAELGKHPLTDDDVEPQLDVKKQRHEMIVADLFAEDKTFEQIIYDFAAHGDECSKTDSFYDQMNNMHQLLLTHNGQTMAPLDLKHTIYGIAFKSNYISKCVQLGHNDLAAKILSQPDCVAMQPSALFLAVSFNNQQMILTLLIRGVSVFHIEVIENRYVSTIDRLVSPVYGSLLRDEYISSKYHLFQRYDIRVIFKHIVYFDTMVELIKLAREMNVNFNELNAIYNWALYNERGVLVSAFSFVGDFTITDWGNRKDIPVQLIFSPTKSINPVIAMNFLKSDVYMNISILKLAYIKDIIVAHTKNNNTETQTANIDKLLRQVNCMIDRKNTIDSMVV